MKCAVLHNDGNISWEYMGLPLSGNDFFSRILNASIKTLMLINYNDND